MANSEMRHIENEFVEIKTTDMDFTGYYVVYTLSDGSIKGIGPIMGIYSGLHYYKDIFTSAILHIDITLFSPHVKIFTCSKDVLQYVNTYMNVSEETYATIVSKL